MGLAYLDDETQPLGLESLAVKYLQVRGWKDLREAVPGTNDFALYNAKDSHYTFLLARELDDGTILNQYKATLRHPDSTKLKKSKYVPSFPLVDAI